MLKTEFVTMCQAKADQTKAEEKARRYSAQVKRKRRIANAKGYAVLAFLIFAIGFVGKTQNETYAKETETATEQKYIARYGIAFDYGSTIITEDGNEWTLIDAPEIENGAEVKVLFDSNETESALDDVIIDVQEL